MLGELRSWAELRTGIEAFVEPAAGLNPTTLLLVADDGEFIRRPIASTRDAQRLVRDLGVPLYNVNRVGYPKRMREYAERRAGRGQRTRVPPRAAEAGPRQEPATPPAPRFDPTVVGVLARHAGMAAPDQPTLEDLRRLWRAARSRVHPDRSDGDRSAWDVVEEAARELGLR